MSIPAATTTLKRAFAAFEQISTVIMGVAAIVIVWRLVGASPTTSSARTANAEMMTDVTGSDLISSLRAAPELGNPRADAVMVEFIDFQCPFCAKYSSETFEQLRQEYVDTGKISYAIQQFPLEHIHSKARVAAEVAQCAREQGQFWAVKDWFISNQNELATLFDPRDVSTKVTLDRAELDSCMPRGKTDVEAQIAVAKTFGVISTPTFIVGRRLTGDRIQAIARINGAVPYAVFREGLARVLD